MTWRGSGGRLQVTFRVDSKEEQFQALANPFSAIRETLVFRRSAVRTGNTYALETEKSAQDLHRGLADSLRDPAARLEVTLEELESSSGKGALMLLIESLDEPLSPQARPYLGAADAFAGSDVAALRTLADTLEPSTETLLCRTKAESSILLKRLEDGDRIILGVPAEGLRGGSPILEVISGASQEHIPLTCIGAAPPWLRALVLSGMPTVPASLRSPDLTAADWSGELASPALRRGTLVLPTNSGDLRSRLSAPPGPAKRESSPFETPGAFGRKGIGERPSPSPKRFLEARRPGSLVSGGRPARLPESEEAPSVPTSPPRPPSRSGSAHQDSGGRRPGTLRRLAAQGLPIPPRAEPRR